MARVGSVTIDGFSLARCAVVKIDAEGTEELIIRGAAETIRRTSPVVYAECNCIADGLPTLELLRSLGYEVRLHVVDAFDKNNFVGTVENVFGQGREAALVGLKREDSSRFDQIKLRPCEMLLRIETADDLALGMLNRPQYSAKFLVLVLPLGAVAIHGSRSSTRAARRVNGCGATRAGRWRSSPRNAHGGRSLRFRQLPRTPSVTR